MLCEGDGRRAVAVWWRGARKKKGYVWEVTTDNKDMDKESGDGDRQPETLCSSWIELG